MRFPYPILLAAFLLTFLGACAGNPAGNAAERPPADDEAEVRALLHRQQSAWNAGDLPGFMAGYWQSDRLIFTSGGRVRRGWQATLDAYQASYTKETMGRLAFTDLEFLSLGADAQFVLGRWQLNGLEEPAGGVFTLCVRKIDGRWRVCADHTSSDER